MFPAQVWIQCRYNPRYRGRFGRGGITTKSVAYKKGNGTVEVAALHLEQKMQDAGWKPDVERWESDTDSEGSDHEVDIHEGSISQTQVLALCM